MKSSELSESEIRPDDLKEEQQKSYERDIKKLLSFKESFKEVACPACNSEKCKLLFKKYGLHYNICQQCSTVYISPRPTHEILNYYYKNSENYQFWNKYIFPQSEGARRKKIFIPRVKKAIKLAKEYCDKPKVLVEVGSGYGIFCEEIKKSLFFEEVFAIEPTPSLAESCRMKQIKVIEKPIEEVNNEDFENKSIDVIVSYEVIEHLFDPKAFIVKCYDLLSPNGIMIITCPNFFGFDILTLQELSDSVDTEHLNYFNTKSISSLMKDVGFDVIDVETPGKLDAELVRKKIISGKYNIENQQFLKYILVDEWDQLGNIFQQFLERNCLSSHMLIIARKKI
jgi:2-polyprenyl-3-methyl-5-hydroxy-6-metoxy-1,4-benzoquinol methylase